MKYRKLFITVEQALSLQRAGVNMLNAAFWFVKMEDNSDYEILPAKSYMLLLSQSGNCKDQYCPTFTLQECLSSLPKKVLIDDKPCFLNINYWKKALEYIQIDEEENTSSTVAQEQFSEDNMIESVFNFLLMTADMVNSGKWYLPITKKDKN